jgi:hypothetical protein
VSVRSPSPSGTIQALQIIKPQLTEELTAHVGRKDVWRAPAFEVRSYRHLVEQVARLSYLNRNHLLFFRGQDKDYQSRADGSTLYPAIYRGDSLSEPEMDYRFAQLDAAAQSLVRLMEKHRVEGAKDVSRKRYIQWSVLQHYEVVATPLLDVTHSLRVACSFAQRVSSDPQCYIYVLALPYVMNRISINSEEDIVNVRLLSICPPSALRPYFQDGYMAGTPDVTARYEVKTELDFRNRLVAKFAIPRAKTFWDSGSTAMDRSELYPANDRMADLCREVQKTMQIEPSRGELGQFLVEWGLLEERLLGRARQITERNLSGREALNVLASSGRLPASLAEELHAIRRIRNTAAHRPTEVDVDTVSKALRRLRDVVKHLPERAVTHVAAF